MRTNLARTLRALAVAGPLLAAVSALAQDDGGDAPEAASGRRPQARMTVKVVADRLVARCEISTAFRRIGVNLLVDYARPCGLELHNRAADGIGADRDGGQPITIHLPGFNLVVPRREHGDEDFLNELTRLHSAELGEVACVGTIGAEVLSQYHVTLDLRANVITLEPPHDRTGELPSADGERATVAAITVVNGFVWLPVTIEGGARSSMALGTGRVDTVVDRDLAEDRGRPAGDVGAVKVGTIDLAAYVAFRPVELVQVHPDGAFGVTGLNLLRHFRVEIDRVNRFVRLTETAPAAFPEEDLACFRAMAEEAPEPLVAFLDKHGETRLGRDAAQKLLDLLIELGANPDQFDVALKWMDATRVKDLRATEALTTMKHLLEARLPAVAIRAGKLAVASGREDRYPESVHRLHAKIGELLVEGESRSEAWEHLLSAAFGLPEDGLINLHLGRFYELEGRWQRAMSRYVQAVIHPESGPQAIAGLERVQARTEGERLSVDLVDKLIAGKVYNFGAATRFEADDATKTNRAVLAELFTNAHFGREVREGWVSFAVGAAMGAEGLLSHYPRERLVLLVHHHPRPEPTALQTALAARQAERYRVTGPTSFVMNGVRPGPGAARERDAEALYEENRRIVRDLLAAPSDYKVTGEARVEDGVLKGSVTVKGPEKRYTQVELVLAERGVLYPGKANVVVHRMVARAALTDSLDGVPYAPVEGAMSLPFERALADVTKAHVAHLERWEREHGGNCSRLSVDIDPRQVSVVAIVRNRSTLEVLQVAQIDAEVPAEEASR